jgi:peptidoglycan/xylan/chitin deacetylase (PgdA/CDA1 family)
MALMGDPQGSRDDAHAVRVQYRVYASGVRTENKVALTFDDGPNPPRTEQVLEILAANDVRATFFVLGKWAERYPRTVERILAGGHLIGNHGYAGQGRIGDYDAAEAVIGHLTGRPSRYLRPHTFNFGAYFQSAIASLPTSQVIGGEVHADDWETAPGGAPVWTAEQLVSRVLDHPALGPGAILVFHDGAEWDEPVVRLLRPLPTIAALPRIIEGLKARGLEPVGLDEMVLAEPVAWDEMVEGTYIAAG